MSTSLSYPPDVRICNRCGQWTAVTDFRRRSGGGVAAECRDCHNRERSAQLRRQRARARQKQMTDAIRAVNRSRNDTELRGAAHALLGLARGYHGFACLFADEFSRARPGSQMRCSMLLAAAKILEADTRAREAELAQLEGLTDAELEIIAAHPSARG